MVKVEVIKYLQLMAQVRAILPKALTSVGEATGTQLKLNQMTPPLIVYQMVST